MTAIDTGVGIAGAFGLTRLISSQLYGVSPMEPPTILSVMVLLFTVAILAAWAPGRQAGNQSPLVALPIG